MLALTCYRLRSNLEGKPVNDFDDYVDLEEHDIRPYGPIVRRGFTAKLYSSSSSYEPQWVPFLAAHFSGLTFPPTGSPGALLIVQIGDASDQYFAFAFGISGRHLLRGNAWERSYGLRTALNLIYPRDAVGLGPDLARLVVIDAKRRGSETVRSRRQATRAAPFEAFDLDRLRDVVGAATGRPADSQTWGTRISGGDALHFRVALEFDDFGARCREIDAAHNSTDYKDHFGWLDHIQPVTDPDLLRHLEDETLRLLRARDVTDLDLAPPEVIDWTCVDSFRFHFDGHRRVTHPELRLRDFLNGLPDRDWEDLDASWLRRRHILALDTERIGVYKWTVWRCLVGELVVDGESYVLDEGDFFAVASDYLADLNRFITRLPSDTTELVLPQHEPGMRENEYNASVVNALGVRAALLDRQLIRIASSTTPVEVCDILTDRRQMVHVKRHLGSRDLSHLFSQGYVSADLLQKSPVFRKLVQEKVSAVAGNGRFPFFEGEPFVSSHFEIVYAIVADWRDRGLADALPFFSKINLQRTVEELTSRGFKVSCLRVAGGL